MLNIFQVRMESQLGNGGAEQLELRLGTDCS